MAVPPIIAGVVQGVAGAARAGGAAAGHVGRAGLTAGRRGAAKARLASRNLPAGRRSGRGARGAGRALDGPLNPLRPKPGTTLTRPRPGPGSRELSGPVNRLDQARRSSPRRHVRARLPGGAARPGAGPSPRRRRGGQHDDEPDGDLDPRTRTDRTGQGGVSWFDTLLRTLVQLTGVLQWILQLLKPLLSALGWLPLPVQAASVGIAVVVLLPSILVILDGIPAGLDDRVASVLRWRLPEVAQRTGIPEEALDPYFSAATTYEVDWTILAAIGQKECDHGRSELPGCPPGTANRCGARGPMQFLGNTWRKGTDATPSGGCPGPASFTADPSGPPVPGGREGDGYATDGNGDGVADPWEWYDASHAAARKLTHDGIDRSVSGAVHAYNRSPVYVDAVLGLAADYRDDVADLDLRPPGLAAAQDGGGGARDGRDGSGGDCHVLGSTERYTESRITPTAQRLVDAVVSCFGRGHWLGCYRPGTSGEHPLGRACDFATGPLNQRPTPEQDAQGTRLAEWLVANADAYDVRYVIWQRRIWQASRPEQGWQPYTRYDGCNPATEDCIRFWHYDHIHVSVN